MLCCLATDYKHLGKFYSVASVLWMGNTIGIQPIKCCCNYRQMFSLHRYQLLSHSACKKD